MRPKSLDLFAGAQGSAVGYARAGFEVYVVDSESHPLHPEVAGFHEGDAFDVLARLLSGRTVAFTRADGSVVHLGREDFAVVTASPPCHDHSDLRSRTQKDHGTGWMLPVTLACLRQLGLPFVVENVESAAYCMTSPLRLCGSMFKLGTTCRDGVYRQLRRHRLFESDVLLLPPGTCRHHGQPIGVYGTGGGGQMTRGYKGHPEESRAAMGIEWMSRAAIAQAIPPRMTQCGC